MKLHNFFQIIIATALLAACAGQKDRIILRPEGQEKPFEQTGPQETWQIIESQNGPPENGIPEWVNLYLDTKDGITRLEALNQYSGRYIFIGESRGSNFNALEQWAKNYSPAQDFPRLLAQRVENRLVSSSTLYPDDEYGEYFETLIKIVSNEEYQADKGEAFWIKQKKIPGNEDEENFEEAVTVSDTERYKFFILLSIDRDTLQEQLLRLMTGIRTEKPPTREQASAINRIQASFFEGF